MTETTTTTIPAGWKLVPIEPTPEQYVRIVGGGITCEKAKAFYWAMIEAAPASPSAAQPNGYVLAPPHATPAIRARMESRAIDFGIDLGKHGGDEAADEAADEVIDALYRAAVAPLPAAPGAQPAQPIAWLCEDLILADSQPLFTRSRERAERRVEEMHGGKPAWRVTPLYAAAPGAQPAQPDAEERGLTEAATVQEEKPPSREPSAWWAETGTAGAGGGCNKPFWLRHEAINYVQEHGGHIAPLFAVPLARGDSQPDRAAFHLAAAEVLDKFGEIIGVAQVECIWRALSAARASAPEVVGDWKTICEAPQDGMIDVRSTCTYRWRAYRPGSPQLRRGIKGRWQRATDYGWENADLPENGEWKPVEVTRGAALRSAGEGK